MHINIQKENSTVKLAYGLITNETPNAIVSVQETLTDAMDDAASVKTQLPSDVKLTPVKFVIKELS
jgi:hypothetical protein